MRRLTPLADGVDPDVEGMFAPFFPVHRTPDDVDDGVADERNAAMSAASADATASAGQIIVA